MTSLKFLSLELPDRDEVAPRDAIASIRDLIPLREEWTGLRGLSLTNVDTPEDDIVKLLQTHSSTLENLHMDTVCLVPEGSWIQVFELVQPRLHLRSASMGGDYLDGSCTEEKDRR